MNKITMQPLGYLPEEYNDIRTVQSGLKNSDFRSLTRVEIEQLEMQKNRCHDWSRILVTDKFQPMQIKLCSFSGTVRIGDMDPIALEFHDVTLPVGLYNSNISSCDIGKNCSVNSVSYLSRMILGENVILKDINEIVTSDHAKFGNGIVKDGEDPKGRIELEIANEAGGREVLPFSDMLTSDAFLWYKYRDNKELMKKLESFVNDMYSSKRGFYGFIGDRTIIKNSRIIKDVTIGSDAYIKGVNKLKNLTIKSSADHSTQIGEGCTLVNGIINEGCKVFYGAMAVRFQLMAHSSLKYGARLINSILGENSTISCCEVLNSFIFPGHEQHHNSSFLIASVLQGQTNIASGATIGSNHNSRKNDGELVAGRGFWPGLNCSLKHDSKFASFNIIVKGSYLHEINNPLPFSLISLSREEKVEIYPGYWFSHNMYALKRNSWKYGARDKRRENFPLYDFDFLAPDTVLEMLKGLDYLEQWAEYSFRKVELESIKGEELLLNYEDYGSFSIYGTNIENKNSEVLIHKPDIAYLEYKKMLNYYSVSKITSFIEGGGELSSIIKKSENGVRDWVNCGGQFIPKWRVDSVIDKINNREIRSWDELHEEYKNAAKEYERDSALLGISVLQKINSVSKINRDLWHRAINRAVDTRIEIKERVFSSREKDYLSHFRSITFDNKDEKDAVIGKFTDNSFFDLENRECDKFIESVSKESIRFIF